MEYRTFRNTQEKISLLGFGMMRLPRIDPDKPEIDEPVALAMIDEAYRNGVNYFDTAYPYHDGLSESFAGKALARYPRKTWNLASKMPIWLVEEGQSAERIFEEQLQKCGVEYFDFYLCHAMNAGRLESLGTYGIYAYLAEQKKRGRIRHLGFSFHDKPEVLERILNTYEFDFVQLQLNYLDWELQNAKLQYEIVTKHQKQVIVMEPCRGGALADLGEETNAVLRAASGQSIPAWAFRFAGSLPNVLTVLSGMTAPEHVRDNLSTFSNFSPLAEAERKVLAEALRIYGRKVIVPCTGCRYCMDCPMGVDIPAVFRRFNRSRFSGDEAQLKALLDELEAGKRPSHCVKCGRCAKQCPQGIAIPDRLAEIDALYRSL